MNITVSLDINKDSFTNFEDLESTCYSFALSAGRALMVKILEMIDLNLLASRDPSRFRSKGLQKTCLKTKLGAVEYSRRVYVDNAVTEGVHCVHLLDMALGIEPVGRVTYELCKLISTSICESTYRSTARQITELTGLPISHQGVWNIVQNLGESQEKMVDRYSELASANQGKGEIVTKILYEENDGVWLALQGKDRDNTTGTKEMKVGIAYDGVVVQQTKSGKTRRILDNKLAYASFESSKSFKEHKEGIIANQYNVDEIQLRVVNGDGAGWVQNFGQDEKSIVTLDAFHRNQAVRKYIIDKDFQKVIMEELQARNYDHVIECIAAQIESTDDEEEKENLRKLLSYYTNNKDALPGYRERDIDIPETRIPGEVHHANTGSMESNIFTLIANRMKGKRRCWSINGANNLAKILCAYHTIGFNDLFADIPDAPAEVTEELTPEELELINAPIPRGRDYCDGSGYELPGNVSTTNAVSWLSKFSNFSSLNNLSFNC